MASSRNEAPPIAQRNFRLPCAKARTPAIDYYPDSSLPKVLLPVLVGLPHPVAYVVAYSGGPDSTALLHCLTQIQDQLPAPVRAIHVNHQLQTDAGLWGMHCRQFCRQLQIPYEQIDVTITADTDGPEAAARKARYEAFEQALGAKEMLLTAHHQSDQAETLLLRLLRGSGVKGLTSIRPLRPFASGWLARPLLRVPRKALETHARAANLTAVVDPTNVELGADRNYLRNAVVPLLNARWPGQAATVSRAAQLMAEADEVLEEVAALDLKELRQSPGENSIAIPALQRLSNARQALVVRHLVSELNLPMPPRARLNSLLPALEGQHSSARIGWDGGEIRCYADRLYVMPPLPQVPGTRKCSWNNTAKFELPQGLGCLQILKRHNDQAAALPGDCVLSVGFRTGGERIALPGRSMHHQLKKLWQAAHVPPWVRRRTPLVWQGESLWAVGNRWRSGACAAWLATHRIRIAWQNCTVKNLSDE